MVLVVAVFIFGVCQVALGQSAPCSDTIAQCPSLNRTTTIDLMFDAILGLNSSQIDYSYLCISTPAWTPFLNDPSNPYKVDFLLSAMQPCYSFLNPVVCYWNLMTQPQCQTCWNTCASLNSTINAMEYYKTYG